MDRISGIVPSLYLQLPLKTFPYVSKSSLYPKQQIEYSYLMRTYTNRFGLTIIDTS